MILLTLLLVIVYKVLKVIHMEIEKSNYFENRGIRCIRRKSFLSRFFSVDSKKSALVDIIYEVYRSNPNEKLVGFWDKGEPIILISDPEMVKIIAVKEFERFQGRRLSIIEENDETFGNTLLIVHGQKWKNIRKILSPAFTGSKIRIMTDLVTEICDQMIEFLKKGSSGTVSKNYEVSDLFHRLSNDLVASCVFGIKTNSLKDRKNTFYECTQELIFGFYAKTYRIKLYEYIPKIMKLLGVSIIDDQELQFLRRLLKDFKISKKNCTKKSNTLNFLINNRNNPKSTRSDLSERDILSQCFIFLLSEIENLTLVLSHTTYEIAVNPEVQDQLYQEIREISNDLQGRKPSFDDLQKMKYMDMVLLESMRKWPIVPLITRKCNKPFKLEYENGKYLDIPLGQNFWIPIVSFHCDPMYFPNPQNFNPERFSDANKSTINHNAYIPFGLGPRLCIASRFALMQMKSVLYNLILNFSLELGEDTKIPMKLATSLKELKVLDIQIKLEPQI